MVKKIAVNIFLIIMLLPLYGCSKDVVESIDSNGDGKPDIWVHKRNNAVVLTEIDRKYKGKADKWYFWSPDGRLLRYTTTAQDGKKFTFYYTNQKKVLVDGKLTWKNALDLERTYPDPFVRRGCSKTYLYTRDNNLILSELESKQGGAIESTVLIKNFKSVDQYKGPYKGSIQQINDHS